MKLFFVVAAVLPPVFAATCGDAELKMYYERISSSLKSCDDLDTLETPSCEYAGVDEEAIAEGAMAILLKDYDMSRVPAPMKLIWGYEDSNGEGYEDGDCRGIVDYCTSDVDMVCTVEENCTKDQVGAFLGCVQDSACNGMSRGLLGPKIARCCDMAEAAVEKNLPVGSGQGRPEGSGEYLADGDNAVNDICEPYLDRCVLELGMLTCLTAGTCSDYDNEDMLKCWKNYACFQGAGSAAAQEWMPSDPRRGKGHVRDGTPEYECCRTAIGEYNYFYRNKETRVPLSKDLRLQLETRTSALESGKTYSVKDVMKSNCNSEGVEAFKDNVQNDAKKLESEAALPAPLALVTWAIGLWLAAMLWF